MKYVGKGKKLPLFYDSHIRKGIQADLPVVLDLIKELAEYEKRLTK